MSGNLSLVNSFLDPVIHQVQGSTPASIRDSILDARLQGNVEQGQMIISSAIFAAAVNKSTLEQFLAKPELASFRPVLRSTFSISGNPNMTALTLLGHSLLTSDSVSGINFVVALRNKMGQKHIWEGSLDNGSMSEKQKSILKEKAKNIPASEAKLLGSGFPKFTGVDPIAMTQAEAEFWGVPYDGASQRRQSDQRPTHVPRTASRNITPPNSVQVVVPDGRTLNINRKAYDYYLKVNDGSLTALKDSAARNGEAEFNRRYSEMADKDPAGKGFSGSVVG